MYKKQEICNILYYFCVYDIFSNVGIDIIQFTPSDSWMFVRQIKS